MNQRRSRRKMAVAAVIAIAIAVGFLGLGRITFIHSSAPASGLVIGQGPQPIASYGQNGAKSFGDLFRIIRNMTIEFNFTSTNNGSQGTSCDVISYFVTTTTMDDGMIAYKVNLTDTTHDGDGADSESALVWVDPSTGSILQVFNDGQYWTGAGAAKESGVLSMFTTDHWLALLNSSTVTPSAPNQTVNLGSTHLNTTTYTGLPTLTEFSNLVIVVGQIPGNGMQLVLSSNYYEPGDGYGSFRVLSLGTG